jgi:phosphonoacetaldehyde hydrolase
MLQAVVLDWAGTTVDHGSLAPVAAMERVFAHAGVALTPDEVRGPMGLPKKDHIAAILRMPRVMRAWPGPTAPGPVDVDALYAEFIPTQMACLAAHSDVIEGVPEVVARMRSRGLAIGSTTGYTRDMLDVVAAAAQAQGYAPDVALCPGDAGGGRPMPWMMYTAAVRLRVFPMWAIVKVGDTASDIAEGRNAGSWTVGVARTGNEIGLSRAAWAALSADAQAAALAGARERLRQAGADYVVDAVADLDACLDAIDARLARGERPVSV